MGRSIGIDLGTTFSAMAAVNESGKPEVILNREGDRITPSVVLLQGELPVVGTIARRSASSFASNVVQFVKRNMGNPHWEFVTEGGQSFGPEEVSALILKRLKEDAELALRGPVDRAVISVPAYFDDSQRRATIDAGRIAGLDVLRVINEPTAAALAYGIDATSTATVMVYDLGGGTFDVTVMRVGGGELEVLATGGDRNLGGFDWDNALMGWLNQRFLQREGPDLLADPTLEQDLRDKAEIAKRTLTTRNEAVVLLSAEGVTEYVCIMRDDFDELTAPLLQRTETIMNMVLDDAKLTWPDVDQVLLVGGSTRMPAVLRLVEQVSGREPELGVNPDEIVALGAALQAALLSTDDLPPSLENVNVQDVNSHSMGVAAHADDGRMANTVVLARSAQVPCTARRTYCTVTENQTQIELQVTEGEDSDLAYVKIVGETRIEIPPYPKGAPVEVVFSYDADGIIHVSVVDLTAKTELGELVIDRRSNLTELEVAEKSSRIAVLDVA